MADHSECKVDETINAYDLDTAESEFVSLDEQLVARWIGDEGFETHGYRTLTEWFNKRLLKQVYDRHGRPTLGTRLDDEFSTLQGEETIAKQELIDDLEHQGIDIRSVLDSMVSWSTMRHHLKGCLDAEKDPQEASTEWEWDSVKMARDRVVEKVEKALQSYENKGRLQGATDVDVAVQVQLSCPVCPTRVTLNEAIQRGFICTDHLGNDEENH